MHVVFSEQIPIHPEVPEVGVYGGNNSKEYPCSLNPLITKFITESQNSSDDSSRIFQRIKKEWSHKVLAFVISLPDALKDPHRAYGSSYN